MSKRVDWVLVTVLVILLGWVVLGVAMMLLDSLGLIVIV